jgi:transposase
MDIRKPYPSDGSDDEWEPSFRFDLIAIQRRTGRHDLRKACIALRWLVCRGAHRRSLSHDLPLWAAVYQQTQHWFKRRLFCLPLFMRQEQP